MQRAAIAPLVAWLSSPRRRPLILRGARQVGKTWLVRHLAERSQRQLVEINFERDPTWSACFVDNDPALILQRLGLRLGYRIEPERSLLFLDEIQEFGEGLAKLRWFAEELPQLPVIAAGSLLEFTLQDHSLSMPVGRVDFLNLEPLTFTEYLAAHGRELLLEQLAQWNPHIPLDLIAHQQALRWHDQFSITGGMPGIAAMEIGGANSGAVRDAQRQLLATYRADFPKYSRRMDPHRTGAVLASIAAQIGSKFVYTHADQGQTIQVKSTLTLLELARLCTRIEYSSGNGIPLAAEAKSKFRKYALLDCSLLHAIMDTPDLVTDVAELSPIMRSRLAEQMVAQALRVRGSRSGDPTALYYWQRESGRPGEVDHLIQYQGRVIPIEVKSGASGAMKSLHQFSADKKLNLALRIDRNPPRLQDLDVRTTQGDPARYRLVNLPAYLLGHVDRILDAL